MTTVGKRRAKRFSARQFQAIRKRLYPTYEEAAYRLGCTRQAIQNIEHEANRPSVRLLERFAIKAGVDIRDFFV